MVRNKVFAFQVFSAWCTALALFEAALLLLVDQHLVAADTAAGVQHLFFSLSARTTHRIHMIIVMETLLVTAITHWYINNQCSRTDHKRYVSAVTSVGKMQSLSSK